MGICIHLAIARSVTREEWKAVYEESLKMVKAFPLAERREIKIDGIDTICLVKTEEQEETYGWYHEHTRVGWNADGDYESMKTAESYYLDNNIIKDEEYMEHCEDAIFKLLPAFLDYDWEDKRFDQIYDIWGSKTQGEPYHMYLLSIACMIESRLGKKAFVYGDITAGQCLYAVILANRVLDRQIEVPVSCDPERLLERVNSLPVTEKEKIIMFESLFLGNRGAEFGKILRDGFSTDALNLYWEDSFSEYCMQQRGFQEFFHDYLSWGFDLAPLCKYVKFENEDDPLKYQIFVNMVMDAKLHLMDKDCSDPLKIDQTNPMPYSVHTYFAQVMFAGAENKKVDRYIPIEEIRKALIEGLGDRCDVNGIIDQYLDREARQQEIDITKLSTEEECMEAFQQDASALFRQYMDRNTEQMQKEWEAYDIAKYEQLLSYEPGNTMHPGLMKSLNRNFAVYSSALMEKHYKYLMKKSADRRCEFLIEQNQFILIRDKDWKKIFEDIRKNEDAFARYYPMVRVRLDSRGLEYLVKGIILNDDLYRYCIELARKDETDRSDTEDAL